MIRKRWNFYAIGLLIAVRRKLTLDRESGIDHHTP